jgi:hypothetical protein
VDFLKLQKYHGIGQTSVSKTAVSFTPKQPRVFNTRVSLQNHGMVSKLQKYFVSKQGLNAFLETIDGFDCCWAKSALFNLGLLLRVTGIMFPFVDLVLLRASPRD